LISYTLIVNSRSNSSRSEDIIRSSEKLIHDLLSNCEIIYVSDPKTLISISANAAKQSDVVIACGGDGTAQSVARGVFGSGAFLALIPIGSGNDFAKSIGLKTNQHLKYYLDLIIQKQLLEVDMPTINDEYFLNTAGIGFDGLTNFYASKMKVLKGSTKYTAAGIKAFLAAKPFEVAITLDESTSIEKVWLFAIANGAVEGGKYIISPKSINSDGKLEVVIVPAYSRVKLAVAFLLLSLGRTLPKGFSRVQSFKSATFKTNEEQLVHLDGEVGISSLEYKIKLNSKKLIVIGNQ
jgi:YegS/Rv2252/BmrU family lipid kinase